MTESPSHGASQPAGRASSAASACVRTGGVWLPAMSLAWRQIVRFIRQPFRVIGGLATPILFWLLLGSGLGRSYQAVSGSIDATTGGGATVAGVGGGGGYLTYFFTGTLIMIVLFTAIFSTISVIEDRLAGFLQGVLVSPAPRLSIVLGQIAGASLLATGQAVIFLALAPLAGVPLTLGRFLLLIPVLLIISAALSGMGLAVAWLTDSTQGFHSVMNLVMLPMWVLSGAVFPAGGASRWVAAIMAVNPLTYGVDITRSILEKGTVSDGAGGVGTAWVVTLTFMSAMIGLCAWLAGRQPSKPAA